jgi:hypothetical protein
MESPHIRADVIEASEFPHLIEKYQVHGVPKVVINDSVSFEGSLPEPRYMAEVLKAVKASEA